MVYISWRKDLSDRYNRQWDCSVPHQGRKGLTVRIRIQTKASHCPVFLVVICQCRKTGKLVGIYQKNDDFRRFIFF